MRGYEFRLLWRGGEDATKLASGADKPRPAVQVSAQRTIKPQYFRGTAALKEQALIDLDGIASEVDKPDNTFRTTASLRQTRYAAPWLLPGCPCRFTKKPEVLAWAGNRPNLLAWQLEAAVPCLIGDCVKSFLSIVVAYQLTQYQVELVRRTGRPAPIREQNNITQTPEMTKRGVFKITQRPEQHIVRGQVLP